MFYQRDFGHLLKNRRFKSLIFLMDLSKKWPKKGRFFDFKTRFFLKKVFFLYFDCLFILIHPFRWKNGRRANLNLTLFANREIPEFSEMSGFAKKKSKKRVFRDFKKFLKIYPNSLFLQIKLVWPKTGFLRFLNNSF